jgi:hypothetical protein
VLHYSAVHTYINLTHSFYNIKRKNELMKKYSLANARLSHVLAQVPLQGEGFEKMLSAIRVPILCGKNTYRPPVVIILFVGCLETTLVSGWLAGMASGPCSPLRLQGVIG